MRGAAFDILSAPLLLHRTGEIFFCYVNCIIDNHFAARCIWSGDTILRCSIDTKKPYVDNDMRGYMFIINVIITIYMLIITII